jgi:hypothetical protein
MTDPGQAIDDGHRRRLVIIIVIAFGVIVLWLSAQVVGNRRVNDELDRIRVAASDARVDQSDLAFSSSTGGPDPLAVALAVDELDVALQLDGGAWCSTINIERLLSKQSISFVISETGELQETSGC